MADLVHKNAPPKVAQGVAFPFQVSIVSWMDLLGYGGMIAAADFNPWKGHARQFALLQDRAFVVLGTWTQLETASGARTFLSAAGSHE